MTAVPRSRPLAVVTGASSGRVATEFSKAAGHGDAAPTGNALMRVLPPAVVAAAGWRGLRSGRDVVVPDVGTRIGPQTLRFLPWRLVARTAGAGRGRDPAGAT